MKVVIIFAVLFLGVLAGFAFFYEPSDTVVGAAAVRCSFNNYPCFCDDSVCTCGNYTIRSAECYSNSNL